MFSRNFFSVLTILSFALAHANAQVIPLNSTDIDISTTASRQVVAAGFYTCKSTSTDVRKICRIFGSYVDARLRKTTVTISRGGVLFSYADPTTSSIPTGHSCSLTAKRLSTNFYANFDTSRLIKIEGNALKEPLVTTIRLPVRTEFRSVIRYRFGFRFFGRCKRYGRDTSTVYGGLSTESKVVLAFSLNPTITRISRTTYMVSIEPRAVILFDLDNTNIHLNIKGRSILTQIWISVTAKFRIGLKAVEQIFRGKSLKSTLKGILRRYALNIGHVLVLSWFDVPSVLRRYVLKVLSKKVIERRAEKAAQKLGKDQEDRINDELKRIFRTNSQGKTSFFVSI